MKDTNGSEDWRVLCELASKEKDPEKLIDVIVKITQELEECDQKPRYHVETKAALHSVAPQLSQPTESDC
jgi:hypothetical protein